MRHFLMNRTQQQNFEQKVLKSAGVISSCLMAQHPATRLHSVSLDGNIPIKHIPVFSMAQVLMQMGSKCGTTSKLQQAGIYLLT